MSEKSGINGLSANKAVIVGYYSISGVKLPQKPQSGMFIILYSRGKTEKVLRK